MGLRTCNLQAAPSSWPGACYRGIPRMPTATRSSSQPAARAASWEEHGMLTARMACIQPVLSTRFVWVEELSRDCRYVTDGIILEHGCATRIFSIVCDVHDQPPSWAEYNTATYAHYACTMQSLSFSTSYSHTATLLHSRAFLGCAPTRPSEKSKHRHANRWRHQGIQPSQADKARAHGQPLMCGVQRAENPPHVRPERAWRGMPGVRGSNVPASHPHLRNQRGMQRQRGRFVFNIVLLVTLSCESSLSRRLDAMNVPSLVASLRIPVLFKAGF